MEPSLPHARSGPPTRIQEPIAIVGMAVMLPGAPDLKTYWQNLIDGVDAISEVPDNRWDSSYFEPDGTKQRSADQIYCRRGGFIDSFAQIDSTSFGIMPTSVAGTEPDQLIALHVAAQAIQDAGGIHTLPLDRQRTGIILGRGGYLTPGIARLDQRVRTAGQLVLTLSELFPELPAERLESIRAAFTEQLGPAAPESAIGLVPNLTASRVANRLDLRGPAYTVDAACASSLVAIDHAVHELASGRCDVVLAGGVHHCHDITFWSVFNQLGALSKTQQIRPFHRDADGVLIGEGTGVVVLKRLADAQRDSDRIYAVIRGTGIASDGKTASLFNPDPGGQVRAVKQAWAAADLDPAISNSLGMLEAHGTATAAGDSAELETIGQVFGECDDKFSPVIGSVKSMIGHTMPAAGIAGLIKAALAVHHGVLLPTLHCEDPNPVLESTRFRPISTSKLWETAPEQPLRRAGVNAFGFGGINAHVVIEQAPSSASIASTVTLPVFNSDISAKENEPVLRLSASSIEEMIQILSSSDSKFLFSKEFNLIGPTRLAIVNPNEKRLALARKIVNKGQRWQGRNDIWFSPTPILGKGKGDLAFVFPGLESEFHSKGEEIAKKFGLSWTITPDAQVGDVGRHGEDVFELGRLLNQVMNLMGIHADAVAGHSVGEWTAMVAAGIHSEEDVDTFLAQFNPDSMEVPGVAFAVFGTSAQEMSAAIAGRADVVLSHDNAPKQAMLCGPLDAIQNLVNQFRQKGIISQVLPFQSGFHTPMLEPYLSSLRQDAAKFNIYSAEIPMWSATTAEPFPTREREIRELFIRHLLEPVRFRPMIEAMHSSGIRGFIQMGFGQIGSLISDILHGSEHLVVATHSTHKGAAEQLLRVGIGVWAGGLEPNLTSFGISDSASNSMVGTANTQPPIPLDLGAALVKLPKEQLSVLTPPPNTMITNIAVNSTEALLNQLTGLAPKAVWAKEFSALVNETSSIARELMLTAQIPQSTGTVGALSSTVNSRAKTSIPITEKTSKTQAVVDTLEVSIEKMPYLRDHSFFRQREGWPIDADRWPIVAGTTVIDLMSDFARQSLPGTLAIELHDIRLHQWISVVPSVNVPVTVTPVSGNKVSVAFGTYSRSEVILAESFPTDPPDTWNFDKETENPCPITAKQLYDDHWMFHGPQFQGVSALHGFSDNHITGTITTPIAPGALLDNVGQILGVWVIATQTNRTVVFPVGMDRVRFYGPEPKPGTVLECLIKITSINDLSLEANMQLVLDGKVWAEFTGWRDRRFDSDPEIRAADRYPGRNTLSTFHDAGWSQVQEKWPDLATRDLIMRNMLGSTEREMYEKQPPRTKRQWLLGRIAAKDAVRKLLWRMDPEDIYPAELEIHNDNSGKPYVIGIHGREIPELTISIAHRGEIGVGIAHNDPCGIDIEIVTDHPESTYATVLTESEKQHLDAWKKDSGEPKELWFARFWTAKEAVAKARGTGLQGRPRSFEVIARPTRDSLLVQIGEDFHPVHHTQVSNQENLTPRDYVVSWTEGVPVNSKHKNEIHTSSSPIIVQEDSL
ncbi:MAG: beta-ketoacyl synthase N-terminal-like domain-containing protein [Mycobacteriaceae bacterium]